MRDILSAEIADSLTVLWGYQQLLLDGAFGPLTEPQKDILAMLTERARRLSKLLQELESQLAPLRN